MGRGSSVERRFQLDQPPIDTKGIGDIPVFYLISRLRLTILLVLFLVLLLDPSFVWAQSTSAKSYSVPNHGRLELAVPKEWKDSMRQPPQELPPTITFSPGKGSDFKFLVTAIWSVISEAGFNSPQKIRELLESRGKKLLASAVEQNLVFRELRSSKNAGYTFSLTDKSAQLSDPDDYKYMTQGAIGVGDLMVMFTFLSHKKASVEEKSALEMIRNAVQKTK